MATAAENKQFVVPEVEIGEFVHWHPDGDKGYKPSAARVTGKTFSTVDLIIDTRDGTIRRFGVHHIDDPSLEHFPDVRRNGGWQSLTGISSVREMREEIDEVNFKLKSMAIRVDNLQDQVDKLVKSMSAKSK